MEKRIEAYRLVQNLQLKNLPVSSIVRDVAENYGVATCTCYSWLNKSQSPYGKLGHLEEGNELYYVLGALLGDGYAYHWRSSYIVGILVKEESFARKFAQRLSVSVGRTVHAYRARTRNLWFVKVSNFDLYSRIRELRKDFSLIGGLINRSQVLAFIEGFFDAEGCVKIIRDPSRRTAKICLDITNTQHELLLRTQDLLKQHLNIQARISAQVDKRANRKVVYHLRIYKKSYVQRFFIDISTTKLVEEKKEPLKKWLERLV